VLGTSPVAGRLSLSHGDGLDLRAWRECRVFPQGAASSGPQRFTVSCSSCSTGSVCATKSTGVVGVGGLVRRPDERARLIQQYRPAESASVPEPHGCTRGRGRAGTRRVERGHQRERSRSDRPEPSRDRPRSAGTALLAFVACHHGEQAYRPHPATYRTSNVFARIAQRSEHRADQRAPSPGRDEALCQGRGHRHRQRASGMAEAAGVRRRRTGPPGRARN
jgi:hypothetical protein